MYKLILCTSLNKKYLFRLFCGLQDQQNQFFRAALKKKNLFKKP